MGNLKVISKFLFSAAFSPASQSVGENIEKFARFSILADFFELGYRIVRAGGHPWSPFDRICVGCIGKPICESSLKTAANGHQPSRLWESELAHSSKISQESDFHPKIDYRKTCFFGDLEGVRCFFEQRTWNFVKFCSFYVPDFFSVIVSIMSKIVCENETSWDAPEPLISLLLSHSSPCSWAISVLPCCGGATFESKSNANNKAKQSSALWTHCLLGSTKKLKMPN